MLFIFPLSFLPVIRFFLSGGTLMTKRRSGELPQIGGSAIQQHIKLTDILLTLDGSSWSSSILGYSTSIAK